jgi:hypothetical protein
MRKKFLRNKEPAGKMALNAALGASHSTKLV